jgi:hypothetical protein
VLGLQKWVPVTDYFERGDRTRDGCLWYLSSGKSPVLLGDAYQRYTSLFDAPRGARPRPENHAGIRPDWTCLVKGPDRVAALRALDETSPVWRPAWQGFQGWFCPALAGGKFNKRNENKGLRPDLLCVCPHLFHGQDLSSTSALEPTTNSQSESQPPIPRLCRL